MNNNSKKGFEERMGTQSLGELIEDESLMNMLSMKVRHVELENADIFHFYFDVIRELGLLERIVPVDMVGCIGGSIVLILLGLAFGLYRKAQEKLETYDESISVRGQFG